MVFIDYQILLK